MSGSHEQSCYDVKGLSTFARSVSNDESIDDPAKLHQQRGDHVPCESSAHMEHPICWPTSFQILLVRIDNYFSIRSSSFLWGYLLLNWGQK